MLKKTSFLTLYTGVQSCVACPSHCGSKSSTSPHNLPTQRARSLSFTTKRRRLSDPKPWKWTSTRCYATVRDSGSMDFRDNMNWPCRKTSPSLTNPFLPSPYEIFDIPKSHSYCKATKLKYFELVKIYHPDRSSQNAGCASLTHNERLERYRLIVLAHEILSDPSKRKAYDSYGAGWGARVNSASRHTRGYSSTSGQQYGQGSGYDNSPFANATWEDWERWYRRSATQSSTTRQAYEGLYVNPNAFAAFVIILAVLSGILQATRAGQLSSSMAEQQLAFTQETSRFMSARASEYDEGKLNKEGRVRHFLEKRDPTRFGLKEEEEKHYRKHFGGGEGLAPLGRKVKEDEEEVVDGDGKNAQGEV